MNKNQISKIIWGLILVCIAVGMVMFKLGNPLVSPFPNISVWQILLGAGFLAIFIESILDINIFGSLFSLAVLGIIFNKTLHIEALVPWTLLGVALLLTIALNLIFGNTIKRYKAKKRGSNFNVYGKHGLNIQEPETVEGDTIYEKVSFSGATKYIRSTDLKYADLECSFGGMEVYFDKAEVPSGSAVINLHTSYSGVELYIPKEWNVINKVNCFAGAVNVDGNWTGDTAVTITLQGSTRFGGVEVNRV